jgi:DNA-binding XRE family transcriptional regulator
MPNLAKVLKEEIARLARRELRRETKTVKKASAQHRRALAGLKRQVQQLQRQTALLGRQVGRCCAVAPAPSSAKQVRFTAKGLRSERKRLGLSAADYARLAGVSALSIYAWESGKVRPRQAQVVALAALRGLGKREVAARLSR